MTTPRCPRCGSPYVEVEVDVGGYRVPASECPNCQRGDCFIVAGRAVLADPTLTLVHGIPLGTAGETEGKRYWHAWVERSEVFDHPHLPGPARIDQVIDRSNGNDVTMPTTLYYRLGSIERTWRYTAEEADILITATGHWGPWEDAEVAL